MELAAPYRPRPIRALGLERAGPWRVKLYGIAAKAEQPRAALLEATRAALATELPDEGYGVAFAIAHDGGDGCYVLLDWFANENEIHQRLLWAPLDRPGELTAYTGDGIGCVWELAVTDHERRAWLRHVLANPDGPDLEAYLADRWEGDV
jgi:hypothetical protein